MGENKNKYARFCGTVKVKMEKGRIIND